MVGVEIDKPIIGENVLLRIEVFSTLPDGIGENEVSAEPVFVNNGELSILGPDGLGLVIRGELIKLILCGLWLCINGELIIDGPEGFWIVINGDVIMAGPDGF
jgi:hypothetical protein